MASALGFFLNTQFKHNTHWEGIGRGRVMETTKVRHKSSFFRFAKENFLLIIYSLFSIFAASGAILLKVAFLTEDRPAHAFATAPVAKN